MRTKQSFKPRRASHETASSPTATTNTSDTRAAIPTASATDDPKVIVLIVPNDKDFTLPPWLKQYIQPDNRQARPETQATHVTRTSVPFSVFMQQQIVHFKQLHKDRTAETYTAALRSFMNFREQRDIALQEIDANLIMQYEAHLKYKGLTPNTISFYNRILRAAYNRAVKDGIIQQRFPFQQVYTGVDKTIKRAIPLKDIKRIKYMNLSHLPHLDFARDLFLFSFYTRGMSFIDMAYLRKTNLQAGILSYCRRKTGQSLFIKWEPCMQAIIEKHPTDKNYPYLLPILKYPAQQTRNQYKNTLFKINKSLKEIARIIGTDLPLTMYVSRHSWASAAKAKHIPLSIISEGMGHDSEKTTQIYLNSLDNEVIDNANNMIIRDL